MDIKTVIRHLKTSPWLAPVLATIDLALWLTDWAAILLTPRQTKKKSLLILRLDVFGDYLLFRNYLQAIRQSEPYRDYHITYCGNAAVRSVAETFDASLIDDFIWTDIYALSTQPTYRFRFVRQLRRRGFEVVFCPTYSRVLVLDDFLSWATGASKRVGCRTDYVNIKRWEATLGDRLYTNLIDSGSGIVFELERNRRIVEGFLQTPVPLQPPRLDPAHAKPVDLPTPFVVFSLGAGQAFRVWPAERFAAVAAHLQTTFPNHTIVLTGAPSEQVYADAFLQAVPHQQNILDLTGKLTIPQLVYVLTKADLLIANETGTVHVAASTQTPTLVISQGKTLVRWHPYPDHLPQRIVHLYPPELEENRHRFAELAPSLNPESPYPITAVSTKRVIAAAEQLLRKGVPTVH